MTGHTENRGIQTERRTYTAARCSYCGTEYSLSMVYVQPGDTLHIIFPCCPDVDHFIVWEKEMADTTISADVS